MKADVDGEDIVATIKPDKDGIWNITEIKGWTPPQDMPASICLWKRETCTRK